MFVQQKYNYFFDKKINRTIFYALAGINVLNVLFLLTLKNYSIFALKINVDI
ncbi:MAG: hypothetical protein EZS26_001709 [Candidatus Ordinivivax streblomastigis]|uniref:Uncharacterized protein n=1 Tax=Candidatus Ordinivivax streblomastigis TaxID=2540710 RepID=A0A5M8P137_9BACT|nr:MAG: hypothetical protein EZS26_001709 [Candidatus Ordinivivax streblomastigis]